MLGMQGLKARKLMKMEKPRPLKIACHTDQSMESVLGEMDMVSQHLNSGTFDRSLYPSITALCESLKMFGPQLENVYKDQLDKCYISLRNGCRDDRLSLAARYRLLEVIELRAMHWQPNENLINYYKQKLAQIEAEEGTLDDHGEIPVFTPTSVMTPTGSHQGPLFPNMTINTTTMTNSNQTVTSTVTQQQHAQTPILLGPGEVIKNSGKFAKPTRIPGKNYCKDEVVIRNADSGKVMGIKGRRVHMIEELSETIISFQRVAPGARERLVQITGPAEENINQAKQLIEETIRRNASPVRGEERLSSYASLGGSSSSISSHTSDETLQVLRRQLSLDETMLRSKRNTLVHSYSMGDDPIGEYRYTVTHGSEAIKITGSNLHLVRTAKLVLDEYFNGERNLNNISILLGTENGSEQSYGGSTGPSSISPACSPVSLQTEVEIALAAIEGSTSATSPSASDAQRGLVSVVRQPLYPSASKEAFESAEVGSRPVDVKARARRAQFAKTSDERTSISLNGDEDAGPSTPGSACPEASVPSLVPATTSPPPPQSPTTASPPPSPAAQTSAAGRMMYSRAFLLQCASSPLSHLTPLNWGRVVQDNPAVLKKGAQVLEGVVATLSKNGEAAISGVPTYLQLKDLIDGPSILNRELRWTFHRTMSVTEEDDNGNA